jgi:hypothetical protein
MVTYTCVALNLLFIAFAFYTREMGPTFVLLTMITLASIGTAFLFYTKSRSRIYVGESMSQNEPAITSQKILSFRKKNVVSPEDN